MLQLKRAWSDAVARGDTEGARDINDRIVAAKAAPNAAAPAEKAPPTGRVPEAAAPAPEPRSMMKPGFDSDAWQKDRDDRVKASREAGNTHLDTVPAYVETMRGKNIRGVHDPKVKGRILTVDNRGSVYVEWLDAYSQEKEGAVAMPYGKKTVMQTSLGPRDLKDYVLDQAAPAPTTMKERREAEKAREPFEHAGLKVYPGRVRVGDKIEDRWAVQLPENKATGKVLGDTLHATREEAMKAAEREVARFEREQRNRAEQDAADAARKAEEEARKAANRGKSLKERAAAATLDRETSENGERMTRRQWVERKLAEGLTPKVTQEDKIKPLTRAQFNRASNEEQRAHERKIKAAGKKDVYWIGDYEVTKTEYDYAQERKATPAAPTSAPAAPADFDLEALFGTPAEQEAAQARFLAGEAAKKADVQRIRSAIDGEKKRATAEHDDWAGRVYKQNKGQVEFRGDGPSNRESMSIGSINESRRRNAMDALTQELKALDKLADALSTDSGADRVLSNLRGLYEKAQKAVESGNWPGMSQDAMFESMLLDDLKFRGPAGKGNVTSNGLSKAVLSAVKPEAAPAERTPKAQAVKEALAPDLTTRKGMVKALKKLGYEATDLDAARTRIPNWGRVGVKLNTIPFKLDMVVELKNERWQFSALESEDPQSISQQEEIAKFKADFAKLIEPAKRAAQSFAPMPANVSNPAADLDTSAGRVQSAATSEPVATHKDPGEPAEPVTPAVVREAIKTGVQDTGRKPSAMRAELLADIDRAIEEAPDYGDYQALVKSMGQKDGAAVMMERGEIGAPPGYSRPKRTFKVEGDGIFTIQNSVRQLLKFRAQVEKSPGFKDRQAPGGLNERATDALDRRSTDAAIANMVEEGDFQAALDYAEAKDVDITNVKLTKVLRERLDKWVRDQEMGEAVAAREAAPAPTPEPAAEPQQEPEEPSLDLMGFERIPKGNGAFELRDGSMTVSVEPTERGLYQARHRSAKSGPRLTEQLAVEWAANIREDSKRLQAEDAKAKPTAPTADPTQLPVEYKAIADFIDAVDRGGVPLNPKKAAELLRATGAEVSKSARPEEVIDRLRAALARARQEAGMTDQSDAAEPDNQNPEPPLAVRIRRREVEREAEAIVAEANAEDARRAAPTADPFAADYAALVGKTIEQTVTTDDGKTAILRMDAARALRDFDQREKTLAELKACLGRNG